MKADYRQVSEDEFGPSFFRAPIVGLWAFKYTSKGNMATLGIPDGAPIDNGNTAWFADGNEVTFSGARNPIVGASCIGVWKQTGERTYVLNHIGLSWNPLAPSTGSRGTGQSGRRPRRFRRSGVHQAVCDLVPGWPELHRNLLHQSIDAGWKDACSAGADQRNDHGDACNSRY